MFPRCGSPVSTRTSAGFGSLPHRPGSDGLLILMGTPCPSRNFDASKACADSVHSVRRRPLVPECIYSSQRRVFSRPSSAAVHRVGNRWLRPELCENRVIVVPTTKDRAPMRSPMVQLDKPSHPNIGRPRGTDMRAHRPLYRRDHVKSPERMHRTIVSRPATGTRGTVRTDRVISVRRLVPNWMTERDRPPFLLISARKP